MALTNKEKALLERAQKAGAPVSLEDLASFSLTVSPITTAMVDSALPVQLGKVSTRIFLERKLSCNLSKIVLFPIIADKNTYTRENFKTNKRASNSYFVGINIDIWEWENASKKEKIKLSTNNLSESINSIPQKILPSAQKELIINCINAAEKELIQKTSPHNK